MVWSFAFATAPKAFASTKAFSDRSLPLKPCSSPTLLAFRSPTFPAASTTPSHCPCTALSTLSKGRWLGLARLRFSTVRDCCLPPSLLQLPLANPLADRSAGSQTPPWRLDLAQLPFSRVPRLPLAKTFVGPPWRLGLVLHRDVPPSTAACPSPSSPGRSAGCLKPQLPFASVPRLPLAPLKTVGPPCRLGLAPRLSPLKTPACSMHADDRFAHSSRSLERCFDKRT